MENNEVICSYFMPNILVLPTLNCQASCSYCFGPHMKSPVMTYEVVQKTAEWVNRLAGQAQFYTQDQRVNIIFHGGEPLLAGHDYYEKALPAFVENISSDVSFSMLSNLWALDERYADILKRYNVTVAASLDGPQEINDLQRGEGYFKRTMAGLQMLRDRGIPVFAICTFTPLSAPKADEIFDFFLEQKLDFQFKTVVEPFEANGRKVDTLPYEEHLKLIEKLLQRYIGHSGQIRVKSLERMVRSIIKRENAMYIAGNCLGKQLAVDPEGGIYNCQRFVGMKEYRWATVTENPSMKQLSSTLGYCIYSRRLEKLRDECLDCSYFDICEGGCAYNAFNNQLKNGVESFRDPDCRAYKGILDNIVEMIGELMAYSGTNSDVNYKKKVLRLLLYGIPSYQWRMY